MTQIITDMQIGIRLLRKDDLSEFIQLIDVFGDVFEMKDFVVPERRHLQNLLNQDNFAAIIATHGNKTIGGLTVYTWQQYYSVKPLAYIYDLAVSVPYQRQGVGKKLIAFTTDYYGARGYEEIFVQADRVDGYAIDFYRKTKPTAEEDVIHFSYIPAK